MRSTENKIGKIYPAGDQTLSNQPVKFESQCCCFYTRQSKHLIEQGMKSIEKELDIGSFIKHQKMFRAMLEIYFNRPERSQFRASRHFVLPKSDATTSDSFEDFRKSIKRNTNEMSDIRGSHLRQESTMSPLKNNTMLGLNQDT